MLPNPKARSMITDFKSASRNTEAIDIKVWLHLGHPVCSIFLKQITVAVLL